MKMLETWVFWVSSLTLLAAFKEKMYFNYRLQKHRYEILGFSTKNPRGVNTFKPKCIYRNLPSCFFFGKKFVKATVLLKKLLNSWFDEKIFSESIFFILPHCDVVKITKITLDKFRESRFQVVFTNFFYLKNISWKRFSMSISPNH